MQLHSNGHVIYISSNAAMRMNQFKQTIYHSAFPKRYSYAGYLSLHTEKNHGWLRLYFVLYHNFLLCSDDPYSQRLSACIPLERSNIRENIDRAKPFELTLHLNINPRLIATYPDLIPNTDKKFYFRADSPKLCSLWIKYIKKASKLKIKKIYHLRYKLATDSSNNAKVIAARHCRTNEGFAIKCIDKRKYHQRRQTVFDVLTNISNPYVVQVCDIFENRKQLYLAVEMCHGQLVDQIATLRQYTVHHCINIIHQIAKGIKYMHSVGIIHKDLKIQNILCTRNAVSNVKICHYGISHALINGNSKQTFALIVLALIRNKQNIVCVIPTGVISICFEYFGAFINVDILSYPAPELLINNKYDYRADYWSIGIISYILICGFVPFNGNKDHEIVESILKDEIKFDYNDWKHINDETKELIEGLLEKDPSKRKTCNDVLQLQKLSKFKYLPLRALPKFTKIKNCLKQSSMRN